MWRRFCHRNVWICLILCAAGANEAMHGALLAEDECIAQDGSRSEGCAMHALQKGSAKQSSYASLWKPDPTRAWELDEASWNDSSKKIRVACVGTSITYGYHSADGNSYPEQLQVLLGEGYEVRNYGHNSAAIQPQAKTCEASSHNASMYYYSMKEFGANIEWKPDFVISNFGTNDAKNCNWDPDEFIRAYSEFIRILRALDPEPTVFLMTVPPLYRDGIYGGLNQSIINTKLNPIIKVITEALALAPPIDVFEIFKEHCPDFNDQNCDWISGMDDPSKHDDGAHPNNVGYARLARAAYEAITNHKE